MSCPSSSWRYKTHIKPSLIPISNHYNNLAHKHKSQLSLEFTCNYSPLPNNIQGSLPSKSPITNKKCKTPRSNIVNQTWQPPQFRKIPNVYHQAPIQQGMNAKRVHHAAEPYSITSKTHLNLFYCHSCGYNVDHDVWCFPYKKEVHVPNTPRDKSYEYYGASMKA